MDFTEPWPLTAKTCHCLECWATCRRGWGYLAVELQIFGDIVVRSRFLGEFISRVGVSVGDESPHVEGCDESQQSKVLHGVDVQFHELD